MTWVTGWALAKVLNQEGIESVDVKVDAAKTSGKVTMKAVSVAVSTFRTTSPRSVKSQAQALTPEEAAARGVAVDTTIHVENLGSSDSTPAGAANNDTATRATGASGGTPPAPAVRP